MRYYVIAEVTVEITVTDNDAINRCVTNADGWRDSFYDLHTRERVLTHWAYNAIANGRTSVEQLDGWADLPRDAVRMTVTEVDAIEAGEA